MRSAQNISPGIGPVLGLAGSGVGGHIAGRTAAAALPGGAGSVPAVENGRAAPPEPG